MGCEQFNTEGPSFQYYDCLCQSNTKLKDCYSLCPDDPTLQLESQSQVLNINNICGMRDQYSSVSSTSTSASTTTPSGQSTITPPPPMATVTITPSGSNATSTTSSASTMSSVTMMAPISSGSRSVPQITLPWQLAWIALCITIYLVS